MHELIARAQAEATGMLKGAGADVERRAEDSLVAVFGLLDAAGGHELAAIEALSTLRSMILERNRTLEESRSPRIAAGVGVSTGPAVAGVAFEGPYLFGKAVDLATHLSDAADHFLRLSHSPNVDVWVDAATYATLRHTFTFRRPELPTSFLPAWRLRWDHPARA